MIKIKELPNDPLEALKTVLLDILERSKDGATTFGQLKEAGNAFGTSLLITSKVSKQAATRIQDGETRHAIVKLMSFEDNETVTNIRAKTDQALSLVLALEMNEHFLNQEEVALFDEAELSDDDKSSIRDLMAHARNVLDRSDQIQSFQKRNIHFHIHKIENELHRDTTRYGTFLAAAYEASKLLKQVGKDAAPIAEAIEQSRTITERKIEGQKQIEQEAAPKQIEKLDDK